MGPGATFLAGAVFALLATAGLILMVLRRPGGWNEAMQAIPSPLVGQPRFHPAHQMSGMTDSK